MRLVGALFALAACAVTLAAKDDEYALALPEHKGQLTWSVAGFKIVENSAKPRGQEIGVRAQNSSTGLSFLGFLFLVPQGAPLTSAKCREGVVRALKQSPAVTIGAMTEIARPDGSSVALLSYATTKRGGGMGSSRRAFVAADDMCGDLEFYSDRAIADDDKEVNGAFQSFTLRRDYVPQFADFAMYAQVLFKSRQYKAAAPVFERAIGLVPANGSPFPSGKIAKRIMRDQAGMSYGISGDYAAARRIFEAGVQEDPDYPMYYCNLACADAGEQKLDAARKHLQQAFDRKANMNPGERMPVPTEDDSFTAYKSDKSFWTFLQHLESGK